MSESLPDRHSRAHFTGLDGLRGVAALCVVAYHACLPLHVVIVRNGYLAVDFFFLLSGFVVANAYDRRLHHTLSLPAFVKLRLIRLYPLFLLGMTMGAVVTFAKMMLAPSGTDLGQLGLTALMGALMLPFDFFLHSNQASMFPLNTPAWSLFFEVAINIIYAALLRTSGKDFARPLIAASLIWMLYTSLTHGGLDVGGRTVDFGGSTARTTFSFFVGVEIYKALLARGIPKLSLGRYVSGGVLLLVLLAPIAGHHSLLDLLVVAILFPLVLLFSVGDQGIRSARRWESYAGALSYPLYVTHFPILRVFQFIAERQHYEGHKLLALITLEMLIAIVFAALALRYFDKPTQAFFKRHLSAVPVKAHALFPSSH